MMMSDSLPFTPYDSMEYETVGPQAPGGFVSRDQASDMQQKDLKKKMGYEPTLPSRKSDTMPREQIPMVQKPRIVEETDIDLGEKMGTTVQDIGNYKNVYDLVYILLAVLVVNIAVLFLVRYSPELFGQALNRWYNDFGLNAVRVQVLSMFLGFIVARFVYTTFIKNQYADGKWSPLKFVGTLVGVQVLHDLLFYFGVISQVPRGHNSMIDVIKDYSLGGPKIIAGDAVMMIVSAGIAMLLKAQPTQVVASIGALSTYALPYILYTKNQYS
jgi:hypothetical protein